MTNQILTNRVVLRRLNLLIRLGAGLLLVAAATLTFVIAVWVR